MILPIPAQLGETNIMELKLSKEEIEKILLTHVNGLMPEAAFNRVEWEDRYSSRHGATFDYSPLPPETADE
jgi:hypothetical protein